MITTLIVLGSLLVPPSSGVIRGEEAPPTLPPDGSRIVVIGDSITQAGDYVVYLEAFLRTRFPDRSYTVINHGLSSETASGLSEPDHPSRRPWIHDRFDRDVTGWNPDVVLACYGMNDGIYHPFGPERFEAYQDGMLRLIDRARGEAEARIDVLTPPPYDPYRRQVGDPEAEHFGYRFPAADYDRVLGRYAEWLRSIADDSLLVIDVNSEITDHVATRRDHRASVSITPDGVHPDPTGHWLIAQAILRAWEVPGRVSESHVDAGTGQAVSGELGRITADDGILSFSWRSPLPMPIDPRWDPESIRMDEVSDRLNRHRLRVEGLEPGTYSLLSGAQGRELAPVATLTAEALAEGIDLNGLPDFPTVERAGAFLRALREARSAQSAAWREAINRGTPPAIAPPGEDEELEERLAELSRPMTLDVRIEPAR